MPACGPRLRLPIAAAACWLLGACAAPVAYPRSAELLDGGRTRLRLGTYAVGFADTHAQADIEGTSDSYSDLSAARTRSRFPAFDWVLGPVISTEGGFDLSLDVCELGALGSLVRVYAIDISGSLVAEDREGFRFGLDGSKSIDGRGPLFGVYVDYGTRERDIFDSRLPELYSEFGYDHATISALRDEWRLAVPVGIALRGARGGGAIAVITEYTLWARDRKPPELEADEMGTVTSFEQHWAVFLAGTLWVSP